MGVPRGSWLSYVVSWCSSGFIVVLRCFSGFPFSYDVPRGFSLSYGDPRFNRGSSLFFGVPLRYSFSYGVLLHCSSLLYGVPRGSSLFWVFYALLSCSAVLLGVRGFCQGNFSKNTSEQGKNELNLESISFYEAGKWASNNAAGERQSSTTRHRQKSMTGPQNSSLYPTQALSSYRFMCGKTRKPQTGPPISPYHLMCLVLLAITFRSKGH